jgi:hypothetical protein
VKLVLLVHITQVDSFALSNGMVPLLSIFYAINLNLFY